MFLTISFSLQFYTLCPNRKTRLRHFSDETYDLVLVTISYRFINHFNKNYFYTFILLHGVFGHQESFHQFYRNHHTQPTTTDVNYPLIYFILVLS